MPELFINLDALAHNLSIIRRMERRWHFTFLPVLKMLASHPAVTAFLHAQGYTCYGAADIWEHLVYSASPPPREKRVLINLSPPAQATDVVRLFSRSSFSCEAGFRALDNAGIQQQLHHDAILMVDLGDMREGVCLQDALPLLRAVASASRRARHGKGAHVTGLGVNLGCLYGTCPDDDNMAQLTELAAHAAEALGHPLQRISLGGTVFWNWFASCPERIPQLPEHCLLEFRMGDPLLLGYDMYRNEPLKGGSFRTDLVQLSATVLEVTERDIKLPRHHVHNGRGLPPHCVQTGLRRRALTDCGSLHTDITDLRLCLPGAHIVDYSGNYAILDVTDCTTAVSPGERVIFMPAYWAVARACRTPQVIKTITHDQPPAVDSSCTAYTNPLPDDNRSDSIPEVS